MTEMEQIAVMIAIAAIVVLSVYSGFLLDSNLKARRWGVDSVWDWAVLAVFLLLALALGIWCIWVGARVSQ